MSLTIILPLIARNCVLLDPTEPNLLFRLSKRISRLLHLSLVYKRDWLGTGRGFSKEVRPMVLLWGIGAVHSALGSSIVWSFAHGSWLNSSPVIQLLVAVFFEHHHHCLLFLVFVDHLQHQSPRLEVLHYPHLPLNNSPLFPQVETVLESEGIIFKHLNLHHSLFIYFLLALLSFKLTDVVPFGVLTHFCDV